MKTSRPGRPENAVHLAVLLLAAASFSSCQTRTGPAFDPRVAAPGAPDTNAFVSAATVRAFDSAWLVPPTNRFTLGPGDRIELELVGEPASRSECLVGPDGRIYFYLLPGLKVWGLTLSETKAAVERELGKFIRGQPQVTLALRGVESKRVWLLGRLNTPGIYPLAQPMTLLEAIAAAGGPADPPLIAVGGSTSGAAMTSAEDVADLHHSFVLRQGRLLPVNFHRLLREGDLAQNIYLQTDDFVYLPTAATREVYVLGGVALPQAVPFTGRITLVGAIANAGGTIQDAHLTHVAVVRGSLAEPRIAIVDYRAIARGQAPDLPLEPHDIVYVPLTPYRTATRYLDLILDTFARTVGANEGARAVSRSAAPVGVNVPVGGVILGR
jgi:polysaccharide biosynthesis/export protein